MRFIFIFIILLLTLRVFAESYDEPRQRLDPDEFSIMPWAGNCSLERNMDKYFQEMYDCGFNLTNFIEAKDVKYAKKHHLKAVINRNLVDWNISDPTKRAQDYTQKIIKEAGKNNLDNIYFAYVWDEPPVNENIKDTLVAFSDVIRENLKCRPYINLLPNYANPQQLGVESYADYLDYYTQACKLDYISYDHYAFSLGIPPNIIGKAYNESGAFFNEDGFYGNIEAVKAAADRNKVGFVNIIQSVGALHWPDPDDFIIHVQGWSTLAYGAKGISYFTYNTENKGNFRNAPFDEYGMKSPTYRYVAHMNFAIHNIGATYKNLKHINVYHIGNVPKGCKDKSSAINVKNLYLNPVNGEPNVVVGEFIDKNKTPYAMIVNKNPKYSVAVGIEFNKAGRIMKVEDRSYGKQTKPFGGEDVYIMPGHGVLLYVE